jgi:hypothetical protein
MRKEVERMARQKRLTFTIDFRPAIESVGLAEIIRQIGEQEVIRQIGAKKVVEQLDAETSWANLPEAQRRKLKRLASKP